MYKKKAILVSLVLYSLFLVCPLFAQTIIGSYNVSGTYTGSAPVDTEFITLTFTIGSDNSFTGQVAGAATLNLNGNLNGVNVQANGGGYTTKDKSHATCILTGALSISSSGPQITGNLDCVPRPNQGLVYFTVTCSDGACLKPLPNCTLEQIQCGTSCVNANNDSSNCGSCGTICPNGFLCQSGKCLPKCTSDEILCNNHCVKTNNDPSNCGACGNVCPKNSPICTNGQCTLPLPTCTDGQTLCGISCANTANDVSNCGSCGTACASNQACQQGQCVPICSSGQTLCGNSCINTYNDSSNCGSCGRSCPSGNACVNGQCGSSSSTLLIVVLLLVIAAIAFFILNYLGKQKKPTLPIQSQQPLMAVPPVSKPPMLPPPPVAPTTSPSKTRAAFDPPFPRVSS